MLKIAPSILSADFTCLGAQLAELEAADQIHIDVMDGRFVSQISYGIPIVKAVRQASQLPLDVHLMVVEPERQIEAFAAAGADMLTIHLEATPHVHAVLQRIRQLGLKAGIALNPHTPAILLSEILHMVDYILVLAVNPGMAGQQFLPEMLTKIQHIHQMIDHRPIDLGVDGGITLQTAASVTAAGGNVLIAGTAIFNAPAGLRAGIDSLREIALQTEKV